MDFRNAMPPSAAGSVPSTSGSFPRAAALLSLSRSAASLADLLPSLLRTTAEALEADLAELWTFEPSAQAFVRKGAYPDTPDADAGTLSADRAAAWLNAEGGGIAVIGAGLVTE